MTNDQQKCFLCDEDAGIVRVHEHDESKVTCRVCIGYNITGPLAAHFQEARKSADRRVLDHLDYLSEYAAQTHMDGGNLRLTSESWVAAALEQRKNK